MLNKKVTVEDLVNCHARLLDVLGFDSVYGVLGCSFGGMQSLQFSAMYPKRVQKVATICGTSKTSPGTMAVRLLQREVIALTGGDATGFKLAKKLAIRSGDYLEKEELQVLLNKFFDCKETQVSPFNKPIFISLEKTEIEQKLN